MKIVVYNSHDQYAFSRKEIERIRDVLPKAYLARIREFHIAHSHPAAKEVFEFNEEQGIAYFIRPVKEKNAEIQTEAVKDLLVGLSRIRSKSRFFLPLKERERETYSEFINHWMPVCLTQLRQA